MIIFFTLFILTYPESGTWEPETIGGPRPGTTDTSHRWDLVPETQDPKGGTRHSRPGTLKVDFQKIFSVFSESWRFCMNSCSLCIYVYFICFSFLYHQAYKLLIFHHLNELLFPSFCKKLPPCSCYKIFKFRAKPMIIVRSYVKGSEKDLNRRK